MDRSESFIAYLNSLDDEYYFFLANTVLGRIPTPFHKPVLNQKILSFLLNDENRISIFAALDQGDRKYISFIILANKVSAKDIGRFFPEDSHILVVSRLSNLADRLVLLKDGNLFRINPVLEDLAQEAFDIDLILGTEKPQGKDSPFVDRNILFAVANILISGSAPVREANTHHFLKSGKLKSIFPQFTEEQSRVFFCCLKKLLISHRAVRCIEGRFMLDRNNAERLLALDPLNLMVRAIADESVQAIAKTLGLLRLRSMDFHKLSTLFQILSAMDEQKTNDVLNTIECFGFFTIVNKTVHLNPAILEPAQKRSNLTVDSDMKVSFFGTPQPDDILYLFSDVVVCDKLVTYGITKDSFFRALELGLDKDVILNYLGMEPDSRFSMWQDAFSRLRIYDGILINCDKDIRNMIEHHPELKDHIIRSFGEDLLLMRRSTFSQWQEKLAYALDIRNLPITMDNPQSFAEEGKNAEEKTISLPDFSRQKKEESGSWDAFSRELLEFAKAGGCDLVEIAPLIEDRLIVSKAQIDKSFRYAGRISASGLDYNAKLSAIRNAISKSKDRESDLLEIELPSETLIVQPLEIVKAGPTSNVLKSKVLPEGTERSIPVSSIFRVTVLKWTLK